MERPKDYNYYSNNNIKYSEWPRECKDYKNYLTNIRRHPEWIGLSTDEILARKRANRIANAERARKSFKTKLSKMSPEEIAEMNKKKGNWMKKLSGEEKEKKKVFLRNISKNFWDGMSDEERKEFSKRREDSLSEEHKALRNKRLSEAGINHMRSIPKDELSLMMKEKRNKIEEKFIENPEFRKEQYDLLRKNMHAFWDNISDEYRKEISNERKKYWKNLDPETKKRISARSTERNNKWWASRTEEQLEEISLRMTEFNKNMDPDTRRSIIISAMGNNKFHQKFENMFNGSDISKHFYYKPECYLKNDITHSWDYGIYDKETDTLQMVVDLDGSYFHADSCDYDGMRSKEEYDERRMMSIMDIKYIIIPQANIEKSFSDLELIIFMNINEFNDYKFNILRAMPFPEISYTKKEINNSFTALRRMMIQDDSKDLISLNTRLGDRIIFHFHKSIYYSKLKDNISPHDAWKDDKILKELVRSKYLYHNHLNRNKILQGFNLSPIGTRVPVFSAGRAKILIDKYLSEFDEIFDPFSSFSGRMLGALSLDKRYIGQDVNELHVLESNKIINFLKENNYEVDCNIICKDILRSSGEYQCLFTCPPYGDSEQFPDTPIDNRSCDDWIDECLKRFNCKRYLFVVDNTEKYKEYIVDEIKNKSYGKENELEYVILINKL